MICFLANQIFGLLFKTKPNYESQLITGLILALIVGPLPFSSNLIFLTLLAFIAMASKYVFAYKKQHIFNPAAFAVVITAITIGQGASWWIGDKTLLPFIVAGGLLMVRKLHRFNLIFGFLLGYAFSLALLNLSNSLSNPTILLNALTSPSLLFFTFVMLTEPITSPADRKFRTYFGIFTGLIYAVYTLYLSNIYYSLELALLSANLLFRIIRFSEKYSLVLQDKTEIAPTIWEFIFEPTNSFSFVPGQYLEWSLPHPHTDSRGNRRYFTIASSPSEKTIKLAVKIPEKASSFKKELLKLKPGSEIYATNLEGEFVLEKDAKTRYIFIAGGIGITPFRSIVKYMLDKNLSFPITLFYIAKDAKEFAYKELFKKAESLGVKTVYVVSENPPKDWSGETGRLSREMLERHVPDFYSNLFYISGPQPMVMAYEDLLSEIGKGKIKYKADFFPGYKETYTKTSMTTS